MRILLATDGSPGADAAVAQVTASLDPNAVERIDIVSVEPTSVLDPLIRPRRPTDVGDPESAAETTRRAVEAAGFRARSLVLRGHAAERIVEWAAADRPDLIVLDARSRGPVARLLAGGVSTAVARHAPVPVLVVHGEGPIRRVVLGSDGSPPADAAIDFAARLPFRTPPEYTVCSAYHVPPPLSSGIAPTMVAQVHTAWQEATQQARAQAESAAGAGVERLAGHGIEAAGSVREGPPVEELTRLVEDAGADLVVVGDRGNSGIARFLLGSTSAGLLATPPTSVLVVRTDQGDRP